MKKVIILLFTTLLITSCNQKSILPDNIQKFIGNFYFENAYKNTYSGIVYYNNYLYLDGKETGSYETKVEFEFGKENAYFYVEQNVSGDLIDPETNILKKETLQYYSGDTIYSASKVNGEINIDTVLSKDTVDSTILKLFYSDKSYGYYRGALYYGDLIVINSEKYALNFELKDNSLSYYLKENDSYEGVLFNQKFTVNEFGMLTYYSLDGENSTINKRVVNKLTAKYNVPINNKKTSI